MVASTPSSAAMTPLQQHFVDTCERRISVHGCHPKPSRSLLALLGTLTDMKLFGDHKRGTPIVLDFSVNFIGNEAAAALLDALLTYEPTEASRENPAAEWRMNIVEIKLPSNGLKNDAVAALVALARSQRLRHTLRTIDLSGNEFLAMVAATEILKLGVPGSPGAPVAGSDDAATEAAGPPPALVSVNVADTSIPPHYVRRIRTMMVVAAATSGADSTTE